MSRSFAVGLLAGSVPMAVGVSLALSEATRTHPRALLVYVVGFAAAHDVVFAPGILVAGWLLRRLVGRRRGIAAAVACALGSVLVVALATFPTWRAYGRRADNPSLLPLDYREGLVVALAAAAMLGAAVAVVSVRSAARWRRSARPGPTSPRG